MLLQNDTKMKMHFSCLLHFRSLMGLRGWNITATIKKIIQVNIFYCERDVRVRIIVFIFTQPDAYTFLVQYCLVYEVGNVKMFIGF